MCDTSLTDPTHQDTASNTLSTSLSLSLLSRYKELILFRLTRRNIRGREAVQIPAPPAHHHEVWGDPGQCWRLLQVPVPAPVHPVPPSYHPSLTLPAAQLHLSHSSSPLRPQQPGGQPQHRGAGPLDPPSGWRLLQLLQSLWVPPESGPKPEK